MSRNKITPVTDREINAIINNSVQGAGSRLVGSAAEQKKLFVRPIANTDGTPNVASLVKRLAEETEAAVGQLEKEVDALETPPPPDSLPLMGVFLTYDEENETLNIIGEKGVDSEEVQDIVGNSTDAKFEEIGASLNQLTEQKQDKLTFADAYNPTTNKVATEQTVATEIAKIIGGADTSFDTLKEIADWINAHPESVTEINNKIKANASNISANQTAITNLQTLVQLLETNKQNATASNLLTAAKNIVGAINEVNKKVDDIPTWARQPQKPQYSYNEIKNTPDFIENVDTANILYGTDENGNPALYPTDSVGTQVLVDGQKVKEFNADEKFDKAGGVVGGDVTIQGNLYVSGENSVVDTETLLVKDNVIVANADNDKLAGVSGFAVKTGEVNEETQKQLAYGIMYDKDGDGVKIGLGGFDENGDFIYEEGQAQFLATRADSLGDGNLPKWDNEKKQFVDSGAKIDDYVKFTDVGGGLQVTNNKVQIYTHNSYGLNVSGSGVLMSAMATSAEIEAQANTFKPIVPSTISKAVKEGIVNSTETWTPEAQTKARETIGAVGFTDIAGKGKLGVVMGNDTFCLQVNSSGGLICKALPLSEYQKGSTAAFIAKGTLENIKYTYVLEGLTNYTVEEGETSIWTSEAKVKACETIGAVQKITEASKVYITDANGNQSSYAWALGATGNSIPRRTAQGQIFVSAPTDGSHTVNLKYAEDNFVANPKSGVGLFLRNSDGTIVIKQMASGEAKAWTVAERSTNGAVYVGPPTENGHAVPLGYFNEHKGTKLYLHEITFADTGVGPSERSNRAKIISMKPTPYTSLSMDDFIDGSMINFQICMYEGNEISWASYRHITGFVIYLHGVSANATTTASIRFEDINDGLSDTVTAL